MSQQVQLRFRGLDLFLNERSSGGAIIHWYRMKLRLMRSFFYINRRLCLQIHIQKIRSLCESPLRSRPVVPQILLTRVPGVSRKVEKYN